MSDQPVRPPAVAGSFYPAEPDRLAAAVDGHLAAVPAPEQASSPVALVVPHAGYDYSGPVAAHAYARIDPASVARVVVLGPVHRPTGRGPVVPRARAWRTPLGEVPIDEDLRAAAVDCGAVTDDGEHAREHSIEVQLPFLQRVLRDGWTLLPVGLRPTGAGTTADLLEAVAGPGTLVVVSSDLSHYHDQDTATRFDRDTVARLVDGEGEIGVDRACGADGLNGLRRWSDRCGMRWEVADRRTSGDTGGGRASVVGYAALTLESAS